MDRCHASLVARLALGTTAALALAGCAGGFAPQGPPGATDAGFMGCQVAQLPGTAVRAGDPLAVGEPMAGVPVTRMTPREVGELARSRGLKVTWRYEYSISDGVGPGGPPLAGSTPEVLPPSTDDSGAKPSSGAGGVQAGAGSQGFSECWCEPPPDGTVTHLAYGMASELIVFVRSDRALAAPRQQPTRGWGC